jgi:ABC-type multidrug transport system ATPase subunit
LAKNLEIRSFSVKAGGQVLVDSLNATLHPGRGLLLEGPSGSGKSSLLRCVAGLDDPFAGEVLLDGRGPDDWGWPAWRRRVLLLGQKPVFVDSIVEDALRRPFAYSSCDEEFSSDRAKELLDRLGLLAFLRRQIRELSIGQQQRIAFLRSLLLKPDLLLLDEPSASLDLASRNRLATLIEDEMNQRGMMILLASHDQGLRERLSGLCDSFAGFLGREGGDS